MMKAAPHCLFTAGLRRAQRGVSLLFALMALVVLTLGAVALLRSVDTGLMVLGNLGFKQDALAAGSVGTEAAISWLQANAGDTLNADQRAQGYSAVAVPNLDPTGRSIATSATSLSLVDWAGNGCDVAGLAGRKPACLAASAEIDAAGGNKVRYVITRLCAQTGAPDASNDCIAPVVVSSSGTTSQRGSLGYGSGTRFVDQSLGTYYRIITRTEGVRGTVSYTETLVHF
jgi:type IV pilus assembly protein PilX